MVSTIKKIVVAGDVTVDWHLAQSRVIEGMQELRRWPLWQEWDPTEKTLVGVERGGAARLADLIEKAAAGLRSCQVCTMRDPIIPAGEPRAQISPLDNYHHSYALWSPMKLKKDSDDIVWRVSQFLGMHPHPQAACLVQDDPAAPFLVVLDDAALGFREKRECWPLAIQPEAPTALPWIILKTASPVVEGALWEHLYRYYAQKLIVVIPINDLRRSQVQIRRELSWESTAEDLVRELVYNPRLNPLTRCAYLVVSFDSAGALLYSRERLSPDLTRNEAHRLFLFFDPKRLEGVWGRDHQGSVIGYNTCLVAGLARHLMQNGRADFAQLRDGIFAGVAAMRHLHLKGFQADRDQGEPPSFPFEDVLPYLLKNKRDLEKQTSLVWAGVPEPSQPEVTAGLLPESSQAHFWTILGDKYTENLNRLALKIARFGPEAALPDVPMGTFAKLITVDRQEIESFRSIRNLIREYFCHNRQNKPLSIGVFGPPGSGKSFGIIQVAESLIKDKIQIKEFNLSQFNGVADLLGALHQVRDISLSGKLPLIFWDEFDTAVGDKPLGWLRYFLAPMQDGAFQEQQITHPIGRAIFVFAGSTAHTMEKFAQKAIQQDKEFIAAKGPDFISRLKAHCDVLGPNRRTAPNGEEPIPDPFFIIRRAIMVRVLLERHWPQLFQEKEIQDRHKVQEVQVDSGVLRAFLEVSPYLHGVRSMENIIATCALHGKSFFERSCLPPAEQLNQHVNGQEFLALVAQIVLPADGERKLANEVQRVYSWLTGIKTVYEESNRGFAQDIPKKLARLGYIMQESWPGAPEISFTEAEVEVLAEMEHNRWMKEKIEFGWRYAPIRDNVRKKQPALLPWRPLPPEEREQLSPRYQAAIGQEVLPWHQKRIDRCMVSKIPEMLQNAGFTLVQKNAVAPPQVDQDLVRRACPLTIGVTGHRILTEIDKIRAGIAEAIKKIEATFPDRALLVLSPLAEGADRLVAGQVLKRPGAQLIVPLPLEKSDYLTDFDTAASRQEFQEFLHRAQEVEQLPPAPSRDDAYEAVGQYILQNCDVLIAIWDGQGAQGQGGTGGIVAAARSRKKPIAWVKAGNKKPNTSTPTSLGGEQGKVEFENFS
jgi:hypothetical protein